MPAVVKKMGEMYRVCEKGNGIMMKNGKAVDGGGYETMDAAKKQMAAINMRMAGKEEKKPAKKTTKKTPKKGKK